MKDSLIGRFAVSLAGHDKGTTYLVIKQENDSVYLVDGKFHPLAKPKKKNQKHIRLEEFRVEDFMSENIFEKEKLFDHEIKYAIKQLAERSKGNV